MLFYVDVEPDASIDFYAGNNRSFNKLLPLWEALAERQGTFFVSRRVHDTPVKVKTVVSSFEGTNPLVVNSYHDLRDAIAMNDEHRCYIVFEREYNGDTFGLLKVVSLFLCGDDVSYNFRKLTFPNVERYNSAKEAAVKLLAFLKGKEAKHITEIDNKTVGIVYMTFGAKALRSAEKSISSLHRLGYSYPVAIVGPWQRSANFEDGTGCYIKTDINPFDRTKRDRFQFRAGKIKPFTCLLSPFEYSLYIDADTRFLQPIHEGFELLREFDICVTEEKLTLKQLYNKPLAGWELNIKERAITVDELGGDESQKFINSGVIFYRKNKHTTKLFKEWHKQWLRFQEWDEQLALMRAMHKSTARIKRLPVDWNSPHMTESSIIFHNYGRGDVR